MRLTGRMFMGDKQVVPAMSGSLGMDQFIDAYMGEIPVAYGVGLPQQGLYGLFEDLASNYLYSTQQTAGNYFWKNTAPSASLFATASSVVSDITLNTNDLIINNSSTSNGGLPTGSSGENYFQAGYGVLSEQTAVMVNVLDNEANTDICGPTNNIHCVIIYQPEHTASFEDITAPSMSFFGYHGGFPAGGYEWGGLNISGSSTSYVVIENTGGGFNALSSSFGTSSLSPITTTGGVTDIPGGTGVNQVLGPANQAWTMFNVYLDLGNNDVNVSKLGFPPSNQITTEDPSVNINSRYAAILLYDRELTTGELMDIKNYYERKYNLSIY